MKYKVDIEIEAVNDVDAINEVMRLAEDAMQIAVLYVEGGRIYVDTEGNITFGVE